MLVVMSDLVAGVSIRMRHGVHVLDASAWVSEHTARLTLEYTAGGWLCQTSP